MGLWGWLFGRKGGPAPASPPRFDIDELARRLKLTPQQLRGIRSAYRQFQIPKRSGGVRTILAPDDALKTIQRRINRLLLARLKAHPAATGFERGHSIVTNALPHTGRSVILKLDIKDFFPSITARRVGEYFRRIGWDAESAELLCHLCTHNGALPQGAPTSPRLSNLVNYRLDARMAALADRLGCSYTRYADDLTFSRDEDASGSAMHANPKTLSPIERAGRINDIIWLAKKILHEEGYTLHMRKKLQIRRRHQRQQVTGLVVNVKPALPRQTRRWLRAVEHHAATSLPTTLTPAQLQGWRALRNMIEQQAKPTEEADQ